MTAEDLIKSNSLTNIEVTAGQTVVFTEIALTAVNMARMESKQSPWIKTEDKMPEDNELVLTSSSVHGTKLLVWNDFHKVWDDEDGDDVYCDCDKIDAWMPIPE